MKFLILALLALSVLRPLASFAGESHKTFEKFTHMREIRGSAIRDFLKVIPSLDDVNQYLQYLALNFDSPNLLTDLASAKIHQYTLGNLPDSRQYQYIQFPEDGKPYYVPYFDPPNVPKFGLNPEPDNAGTFNFFSTTGPSGRYLRFEVHLEVPVPQLDRVPNLIDYPNDTLNSALSLLKKSSLEGKANGNLQNALLSLIGKKTWEDYTPEGIVAVAEETNEEARIGLTKIIVSHFEDEDFWVPGFLQSKPKVYHFLKKLDNDPLSNRIKNILIRNMSSRDHKNKVWAVRTFRQVGYWDQNVANVLIDAMEMDIEGSSFAFINIGMKKNPTMAKPYQDRLIKFAESLYRGPRPWDGAYILRNLNSNGFIVDDENIIPRLLNLHAELLKNSPKDLDSVPDFILLLRALEEILDHAPLAAAQTYAADPKIVESVLAILSGPQQNSALRSEVLMATIKRYAKKGNAQAMQFYSENQKWFAFLNPQPTPEKIEALLTSLEFNSLKKAAAQLSKKHYLSEELYRKNQKTFQHQYDSFMNHLSEMREAVFSEEIIHEDAQIALANLQENLSTELAEWIQSPTLIGEGTGAFQKFWFGLQNIFTYDWSKTEFRKFILSAMHSQIPVSQNLRDTVLSFPKNRFEFQLVTTYLLNWPNQTESTLADQFKDLESLFQKIDVTESENFSNFLRAIHYTESGNAQWMKDYILTNDLSHYVEWQKCNEDLHGPPDSVEVFPR